MEAEAERWQRRVLRLWNPNISAFDIKTGKQLWRTPLTPDEENDDHMGGGIAFEDGKIYVTTGNICRDADACLRDPEKARTHACLNLARAGCKKIECTRCRPNFTNEIAKILPLDAALG